MSCFELRLGDYTAAACHLSLLEDARLFRMRRRYCLDERPCPP